MKLKSLIGRKFSDLKEVEKADVLSRLAFDGSMWCLGRLENGMYDVTADITGTNIAIMATLEVGNDEDLLKISDNAVFYNCIEEVA